VAIIGNGATDKPIAGEKVTFSTGTFTYTLANAPNSITQVIDKNYITYTSGTDYEKVPVGVHWLDIAATVNSYNHDTYAGLSGSTFLVTANGSALSTVTFTAVTSALMVADAMAVVLSPTISVTVSNNSIR
jgi:hypothetical protein